MGIRVATRDDVEAMRLIYAPYILETAYSYEYEVPDYAEFLERFEHHSAFCPWLVWEENGDVIGYAYGSLPFDRRAYHFMGELSVYLKREAHGHGIGRKLYEACEAIMARQGFARIYGIIAACNESSCRFHEALGYRKFATFARSGVKFGAWCDTVWYEKVLSEPPADAPFPVSWHEVEIADLL